ncbi:MAG: DUF4862 family protein [Bdellovibrionales bacterium]|nr:DUF4862 family protein [Bdellovibrionales bacterium]
MKKVLAPYAAFSSPELLSGWSDWGLGDAGIEVPISWMDSVNLNRAKIRGPIAITGLPSLMDRIQTQAGYGLASADEVGRRQAVADFKKAYELCRHVDFFEFHSGPRSPDVQAFRRSLLDLAPVVSDSGPALLLEHCDRFAPGFAKGFLDLDSEIQAIQETGFPARILINWGRSALEARSADEPRRHLVRLREHGLLGGIVFSGVCSASEVYGNWADSHAPFGPGFQGIAQDSASLMSKDRVRECVEQLRLAGVSWFGAKIQVLPKTLSLEQRVDWLKDVHRFLGELG